MSRSGFDLDSDPAALLSEVAELGEEDGLADPAEPVEHEGLVGAAVLGSLKGHLPRFDDFVAADEGGGFAACAGHVGVAYRIHVARPFGGRIDRCIAVYT